MDNDRILDKIKKCLEMAKGKGSNPNEAGRSAQLHHAVGHQPVARLTQGV